MNANEDYEVRYWCKEFGCTEQQLRDVVGAAGTSADKVRQYLTTIGAGSRAADAKRAQGRSRSRPRLTAAQARDELARRQGSFDKLGPKKRQEIAFEIALLGQRGLDINNPEQKYALRTLPGKYSALHLLALMYTAFKQIDPTRDSGADFDAEYKMAIGARDKKD